MSRKSLLVLSACLMIGAGVGVYVWADCCNGVPMCHGGVVNLINSCDFYFTVDHQRQDGDQHQVKIWIQKDGDPTAIGYMMAILGDPPYTVCVTYDKTLTLDANSTYYYFACATTGCTGRVPASGRITLMTGNCGG